MAYRLGIDLGATSVAAAVAVDGSPAEVIMLGSHQPQLPSTLYVTDDGSVMVGEQAVARAASDPARAVLDPLQRLAADLPAFDDGTDHVAAESGVAALLSAALRAATTAQGAAPSDCVLSHPVGWDDYQRSCLQRAAAEAGLPDCALVADLQAAARCVASRADPGAGAKFLIIDLGGGSCTVGVAERSPDFVELLDSEHSDHPSGRDFDEAVFRLVGGNLGDQGRELTKDDPAARARAVEVRQACRAAKEILSTASEASVTVEMPGLSKTVRIGRVEFESLVRPGLRDALGLANRLLSRIPVPAGDLAGVALVGGASRMPVVTELVSREWDLPVVIGSAPELDAALGLVSDRPVPAAGAPLVGAPDPVQTAAAVTTVNAVGGQLPVQTEDEVEIEDADTNGPIGSEETVSLAPLDAPTESPVMAEPALPPEPMPHRGPEDSADLSAASVPLTVAAPAPPPEFSPSAEPFPPHPQTATAPGPPAAASPTEQPMPEHLIFDYFAAAATEPLPAVPTGSAVATSPRSPQIAASMPTPPQRPTGPVGQGQRPGPPGQRPMPPGQRPGPATQAYGRGRPRSWWAGWLPAAVGRRRRAVRFTTQPDPGDRRRRGADRRRDRYRLLVGQAGHHRDPARWADHRATGIGVTGDRARDSSDARHPATPAPSASASGGGSATPSSGTSAPAAALPAGPPLAQNLIVVPMRTDDDDEDTRPLYLVDADGGAPQALHGSDGKLSNPMLQKDRTSIIFLEDGTLHVMASDGNDERDLADREPAGCDDVAGASWSQADSVDHGDHLPVRARTTSGCSWSTPNGRLIRRLDAGEKRIDDVTISPDGQTVLYWASESPRSATVVPSTRLPLVGTGAPKKITSGAKGLDGDPSWSPDGSQIAFRRLVGGVGGNADVYVMSADGSGQRAVADTKAADVKPSGPRTGRTC